MVLPRVARLLAALFILALPASAGTLYVPIIEPDGAPGADYQTRVWLTNHGGQAVTVTTVRMHSVVDGTATRDTPRKHRIAAGATKVLTPGRDGGLLEIQAPPSVAVEAEIRNLGLPARQEVFSSVPVIDSASSTAGGGQVVLQGMRRTPFGVRTLLGLVNLGHQPAQCEVQRNGASGARLGGATGLVVPPLSHLPVADVLELLDVTEMADANATVSCSHRFFAYLAITSTATGGTVFVEPSATGASTLQPPSANSGGGGGGGGGGQSGGDTTSDGKSIVYTRNGLIHVPKPNDPTWTHDIRTPPNTDFGKVVVEVDFTVGKWDSKEPNKAHSIFWLHRGGTWPKWANNMIGYGNAFGPGSNQVKVAHNINASSRPYPKLASRVKLERGRTYRLRYVYDAAGNKITMQVSQGGRVLGTSSSKARVRRIRSDGTGLFMLYFGHTRHDGPGKAGPEKPTYGWKYSNARVEFHPL
jgi:hypothetical protein